MAFIKPFFKPCLFRSKNRAAVFSLLLFCFLPLFAGGQPAEADELRILAEEAAEQAVASCEKELLKERLKIQKETMRLAESVIFSELPLSERLRAGKIEIKALAIEALALNHIGEIYIDTLNAEDALEIAAAGCAPLISRLSSDPVIELDAVSAFLIDFALETMSSLYVLEDLGIDLEDIKKEYSADPPAESPPQLENDDIETPKLAI